MPFKLRTPGGERAWYAIALFGFGLFGVIRYFLIGEMVIGSFCVAATICGVGLWFNQQWARWIAVAMALFAGGYCAVMMFTKGFTLIRLIYLPVTLWMAWATWKEFSPEKITADRDESGDDAEGEDSEDKKPMISLALLLREPRYLESAVLAQIVSSAWGGDYSGDENDGETQRYVVGESPLFMVNSPDGMFIIHNHPRPYFDNPEAVAGDMKEMRLQKTVLDNQAWLAVDLISLNDENAEPESVYPQIAKLIAELAGTDCLAIFQPQTGRINVWDTALEEKLRGPDALEVFTESVNPPVVNADSDDPRMKAAVSEARARWPEFVEAFKQRDGENFSIKAPVTVGDVTEFIWIEVDGLEPEYIHGKLGNEPVDLEGMKLGDRVEIPLKDLNDWAYLRNEELTGAFTMKVLSEMQNPSK